MKQPWIYSPRVDGIFILAPAIAVSLMLLVFAPNVNAIQNVEPWMWVALIVGVDVAHVYSTLFRTYADRDELAARRSLYIMVPLLCWVGGVMLYSVDVTVFWRAIAYLAVFHFVRQQYGFMMIYGRKQQQSSWSRCIDQATIYMATFYPLIYWHTHPREFEWFVPGDFISLQLPWLNTIALTMYIGLLALYLTKEIRLSLQSRTINIPKNLLLAGTALSWWVGIVYFNNDLAFTAANVLAHGIPYMALIWIYGRNQSQLEPHKSMWGTISYKRFFSITALPLFLGTLIMLGYIEEGLWDGFVWTEHKTIFNPFSALPNIGDKATLAWLVPLLALPQTTHYVLDAFIWRLREPDTNWKQILFYQEARA